MNMMTVKVMLSFACVVHVLRGQAGEQNTPPPSKTYNLDNEIHFQ